MEYISIVIQPDRVYMTTHQQDSSQPQQSQDSPQETGLGLTMEVMVETEPGMMKVGSEKMSVV